MGDYNIVLTGFIGTEKVKVGSLLSKKLSMRFIDIDSEIERREGLDINSIFAKYGEWYFRDIEHRIIQEKSVLSNYVIVTGEGAVLFKSNIEVLRVKGIIVCLKANPDVIIKNISQTTNKKPLLNEEQLKRSINNLLAERKEYYSDNDYEIDISDLTPEQVSNEIVKAIKNIQKMSR